MVTCIDCQHIRERRRKTCLGMIRANWPIL
ncbi:hypothetical protein OIU92_00005 [Escherichia coli]|nr:hypothetical protein [Escherichia coli]